MTSCIYSYAHISVTCYSAGVARISSVDRLLLEAPCSTSMINGQGITYILLFFIGLLILASRMDCVVNILTV
jgi:hypothetical protein